MAGMGAHIVGQEEARFTEAVNARLDQFLRDLRSVEDFGEGENRGKLEVADSLEAIVLLR